MTKYWIMLGLLYALCSEAQGQTFGLYWKYKDYEGAIPLTAPRWAIKFASWFPEEPATRRILRRVHKVRVLVFEEDAPINDRDWARFHRKAQRRGLEEVLYVRDGEDRIRIYCREKQGFLRQIVALVDTPDEFVLLSLRGRMQLEDLLENLKEGRKIKPLRKKRRHSQSVVGEEEIRSL